MCVCVGGGGGGGSWGSQDPHSTAVYKCSSIRIFSDFIQAWRIEKHETENSNSGGGGVEGRGVSKEVEIETLGEALLLLNY